MGDILSIIIKLFVVGIIVSGLVNNQQMNESTRVLINSQSEQNTIKNLLEDTSNAKLYVPANWQIGGGSYTGFDESYTDTYGQIMTQSFQDSMNYADDTFINTDPLYLIARRNFRYTLNPSYLNEKFKDDNIISKLKDKYGEENIKIYAGDETQDRLIGRWLKISDNLEQPLYISPMFSVKNKYYNIWICNGKTRVHVWDSLPDNASNFSFSKNYFDLR